ncbi:MAG: cupin domain-containing protein [Pseudomonadota bacterium]|nr:cupin domain-containing protein [Pseudomonadota bacterium]
MKRVITGHDANGKAIFVKEEPEKVTIASPIVDWHEVWATHAHDTIPIDVSDTQSRERYSDVHKAFPETKQSFFRVLDFKPGDLSEISKEASANLFAQLPGLGEHMESEDPSMHTTDSIDYGVVLSGSITLELDDGASVVLNAGDVYVQNGTRHAWRVHEPCRIAVVLIGIEREKS